MFDEADEATRAHERAMNALERQQAFARRWGNKVSPQIERQAIAADQRVGLAYAARSYEQQRLGLHPYESLDDAEIAHRHEQWRSQLVIVDDPDVGKPPKERPGFRGHSLVR